MTLASQGLNHTIQQITNDEVVYYFVHVLQYKWGVIARQHDVCAYIFSRPKQLQAHFMAFILGSNGDIKSFSITGGWLEWLSSLVICNGDIIMKCGFFGLLCLWSISNNKTLSVPLLCAWFLSAVTSETFALKAFALWASNVLYYKEK